MKGNRSSKQLLSDEHLLNHLVKSFWASEVIEGGNLEGEEKARHLVGQSGDTPWSITGIADAPDSGLGLWTLELHKLFVEFWSRAFKIGSHFWALKSNAVW